MQLHFVEKTFWKKSFIFMEKLLYFMEKHFYIL